jgi:hypothetical protein
VRGDRWRGYLARLSPAERAERMAKGGRSALMARWLPLLEKWMNGCPREALRDAYNRGYRSGHERGLIAGRRAERERGLRVEGGVC